MLCCEGSSLAQGWSPVEGALAPVCNTQINSDAKQAREPNTSRGEGGGGRGFLIMMCSHCANQAVQHKHMCIPRSPKWPHMIKMRWSILIQQTFSINENLNTTKIQASEVHRTSNRWFAGQESWNESVLRVLGNTTFPLRTSNICSVYWMFTGPI
jgi:hypothetical protein